MKKISNFLDSAHIFKVFLASFLTMLTIAFILFYFFFPNNLKYEINILVCLAVSAVFGILFAGLFTSMISTSRKSDEFWKYSHQVNKLIEDANTKDELQNIFDNEFQKLVDLSLGHVHNSKLKELKAIINTKYKYIN